MPADPQLAKYWVKIASGLTAAQVKAADQDELLEFLSLMSKEQQLSILKKGDDFGLFKSSGDEHKKRRELARAMNVALALGGYYRQQKIDYQLNTKEREKILNPGSDFGMLKARVKKEVEIALNNARISCNRRPDAKGGMPAIPASTPKPITIDREIIAAPPAPVSREFDALERVRARQNWGVAKVVHNNIVKEHKVSQAVAALTQGGAERGERVADFVENHTAELIGSWTTALAELKDVFTNHREWLMFNFITMETAIGDAYKNFELSVRENQKEITDRLNILTMMFGALKHGPFPVSLIGSIGEKAVGTFKADEAIDPRSSVPILVGTSSGFINNLKEKLDDKYQELSRVGPKLASIDNVSQWRQGLHLVCEAQLKCLKDLLALTCNQYFGDSSSVVQKFEALRAKAVQEHYGEIKGSLHYSGTRDEKGKGEREKIKMIITTQITQYKNEQIAAMEKIFRPKPRQISPAEFQKAVEMTLYCQYITLLYKDDNACSTLPLAEKIVDFFADAGTWGILMKNANHKEAEAANRLKWKQNADNRKVLLMFCKWFLRDVNPFAMVIGGKMDIGGEGEHKLITPSIIRTMCADEVRKINNAVKHGRKINRLGYSEWNWDTINAYYSALSAASQRRGIQVKT
jgi:hypothetical protein